MDVDVLACVLACALAHTGCAARLHAPRTEAAQMPRPLTQPPSPDMQHVPPQDLQAPHPHRWEEGVRAGQQPLPTMCMCAAPTPARTLTLPPPPSIHRVQGAPALAFGARQLGRGLGGAGPRVSAHPARTPRPMHRVLSLKQGWPAARAQDRTAACLIILTILRTVACTIAPAGAATQAPYRGHAGERQHHGSGQAAARGGV